MFPYENEELSYKEVLLFHQDQQKSLDFAIRDPEKDPQI